MSRQKEQLNKTPFRNKLDPHPRALAQMEFKISSHKQTAIIVIRKEIKGHARKISMRGVGSEVVRGGGGESLGVVVTGKGHMCGPLGPPDYALSTSSPFIPPI